MTAPTRVLRLAFLAPTLVEAIVAGRQSVDLTTVKPFRVSEEDNWEQQSMLTAGNPRITTIG